MGTTASTEGRPLGLYLCCWIPKAPLCRKRPAPDPAPADQEVREIWPSLVERAAWRVLTLQGFPAQKAAPTGSGEVTAGRQERIGLMCTS